MNTQYCIISRLLWWQNDDKLLITTVHGHAWTNNGGEKFIQNMDKIGYSRIIQESLNQNFIATESIFFTPSTSKYKIWAIIHGKSILDQRDWYPLKYVQKKDYHFWWNANFEEVIKMNDPLGGASKFLSHYRQIDCLHTCKNSTWTCKISMLSYWQTSIIFAKYFSKPYHVIVKAFECTMIFCWKLFVSAW